MSVRPETAHPDLSARIIQISPLPDLALAVLAEAGLEFSELPPPGPAREAMMEAHGARWQVACGTGHGILDADTLGRMPALRLFSSFSAGLDHIDLAACAARGVRVANTSHVLADDVADLAVWLLLGVARNLVAADTHARSGRWADGQFPLGRAIAGMKVGLLGFGHIGGKIAARLAPMGAELAYCTRTPRASPLRRFADLEAMAEWADALIVACPGGPETRHLVNARTFDALGPEGLVVNIARGSVIDEAALGAALSEGRIAAIGLDVFENEPAIPEALRAHAGSVLLPHVGSATQETRRRMAEAMVAAILEELRR